MLKLNRQILMKMHTLIAAFILPVAIMYFVTGAFYTWGVKGSYVTNSQELRLEKQLRPDLTELTTLARKELKKLKLKVPSGKAKVKRIGSAFRLEWTGANRDVMLEATADPFIAKLKLKETSWYRTFVQLHKAKGGKLFKIYAATFAAAMFFLLLTGFLMAWQTPKLRNLTLISASIGIITFFGMVFAS